MEELQKTHIPEPMTPGQRKTIGCLMGELLEGTHAGWSLHELETLEDK